MNKYEVIYRYLKHLKRCGYTDMTVQAGGDGDAYVIVHMKKRDKQKCLLVPEAPGKIIKNICDETFITTRDYTEEDLEKIRNGVKRDLYGFSIDKFMTIVEKKVKKHERG